MVGAILLADTFVIAMLQWFWARPSPESSESPHRHGRPHVKARAHWVKSGKNSAHARNNWPPEAKRANASEAVEAITTVEEPARRG